MGGEGKGREEAGSKQGRKELEKRNGVKKRMKSVLDIKLWLARKKE